MERAGIVAYMTYCVPLQKPVSSNLSYSVRDKTEYDRPLAAFGYSGRSNC